MLSLRLCCHLSPAAARDSVCCGDRLQPKYGLPACLEATQNPRVFKVIPCCKTGKNQPPGLTTSTQLTASLASSSYASFNPTSTPTHSLSAIIIAIPVVTTPLSSYLSFCIRHYTRLPDKHQALSPRHSGLYKHFNNAEGHGTLTSRCQTLPLKYHPDIYSVIAPPSVNLPPKPSRQNGANPH